MRKLSRFEQVKIPLIAAATALTVSVPASADDIDVYNSAVGSQLKPNIVFLLDYSGSMRDDINGDDVPKGSPDAKISILKSAVSTVIQENAGKINAGIGSIFRKNATGVKWPVSDLEADAHTIDPSIPQGTQTVADVLISQLSTIDAGQSTSSVNALAEAAAYFRGDPVLNNDYDTSSPQLHSPGTWSVANGQYEGGHLEAAIPSSYVPSSAYNFDPSNAPGSYGTCTEYLAGTNQCEGLVAYDCVYEAATTGANNSVIGERNVCKYDLPTKWVAPNYVSPITQECQANYIVMVSDGKPGILNDNQTLETVLKAANVPGGQISNCEDLSSTVFNGSNADGNCGPEIVEYLATTDIGAGIQDSNVNTYTVGFSIDGPGKRYLQAIAKAGEGEFFETNEPDKLSGTLAGIVNTIVAGSQSFTQPSIDINPSTFAHDDRTYFSLFEPTNSSSWKGNLKGYFLDKTGLLDVYGNSATISDANGLRFADTSQSFWSKAIDGDEILNGGASANITGLAPAPNNRNLFTFIDGPGTTANYLSSGDKDITDLIADPQGPAALDWLANAQMGDPLHTKPVSVNYGPNKKVVFIATNQGILHAFDASKPVSPGATPDLTGGDELFAFMPKELLSNVPKLYQPTPGGDHVYGLDGTITRWHNDLNNNGYVDVGTESIKLIFGMRRGGNSYYALDVTDPSNPKFDWHISGDHAEFPNLAQSWSRASLVRVTDAGVEKDMLMFGGGYDAAVLDGKTKRRRANGNAIYFVDPANGEMRREVTANQMDYSIPSNLTIIDTDRNGKVDRTYVGDLGGNVWRLDFEDIQDQIVVTKIANVMEGNTDHQPIFYAPSVSLNEKNGEHFLALSFGSGDRTQPMLENTKNWLYMIKDTHIELGAPDKATFSAVRANNLYDATSNDIGSGNDTVKAAAQSALSASRGWKIALGENEKSLSKVTTYQGTIFATTFDPNTAGNTDPCSFTTIGRLYKMNLFDGQPVQLNNDGTITIVGPDATNRVYELQEKLSIPPTPIFAYLPEPQLIVGKETLGEVENKVTTVFWHAK